MDLSQLNLRNKAFWNPPVTPDNRRIGRGYHVTATERIQRSILAEQIMTTMTVVDAEAALAKARAEARQKRIEDAKA
jgi:hypothetical protein